MLCFCFVVRQDSSFWCPNDYQRSRTVIRISSLESTDNLVGRKRNHTSAYQSQAFFRLQPKKTHLLWCFDYVIHATQIISSSKVAWKTNNIYPLDLNTATHVYVRHDAHAPRLTRPYDGPYKVIRKTNKPFSS